MPTPKTESEAMRLLRLHHFERVARRRGFALLAGLDEAGRGPLAGPVVAAAVASRHPLLLVGLDDSKKLSPRKRALLAEQIHACADAVGIGEASVAEIDALNILRATHLAMHRALAALGCEPEYLLLDAIRLDGITTPQEPLIAGDSRCALIAAASIIAKAYRDTLLRALHDEDPRYDFAVHKGYPTPAHLAVLARIGPGPHHRRSFAPVRRALTQFDG